MADNIKVNPGTTTDVATDDIGGVHYPRGKISVGADGSATDLDGTAARGAYVDPRLKVVRLAATPTISTTPAYTAKDAIGGLLTFSNAVRASGGTVLLQSAQLVDKAQRLSAIDLVLFDRTFTAPTDNAIFAPTDAELLNCIGVVSFSASDYKDFSTNSVAVQNSIGLEMVLNGTDLFGALVARSTPQFVATNDIVITLTLVQD